MSFDVTQIVRQLTELYGLDNTECKDLRMPTNDVIEVKTLDNRFALKIYTSSPADEVQWEIDLTLHLIKHGAPVAKPVMGTNSNYLQAFAIDGQNLSAVLFEWAAGEKPKDEYSTYVLLGKAAAQIHQAADTFTSPLPHPLYDADKLIDEQIQRMKKPLEDSDQLQRIINLTERLRRIVTNPALDYGVCHMDLKPDNVHRSGNTITVFDFNSSGESWRAIEPYRALVLSEDYFKAWLEGYRSVRPFSEDDEKAVAAFCIVGKIRDIVWDLGLARSSRSTPLLQTNDLPRIVDEWLEWERTKITR